MKMNFSNSIQKSAIKEVKTLETKTTSSKNRLEVKLYIYWILLMAWQTFRPTSNRSSVDIIVKLALILFLVFSTFKIRLYYSKKNLLVFSLFALYMLFLFFVKEDDYNISLIITYFFPVLFSFLFFVHAAKYKITKKDCYHFFNLIIFADLILVGYSLIFQFNHFKNALKFTRAYGNELSSFLISNHEYALYLLIGFQSCLFCYQFLTDEKSKGRLKYILLGILFLFNIILTFSRTALLGAAVLIIVFILLSKNNKIKKILVFSLLATLLILFFSETLRTFVIKIVLKDNHDAGRFEMWDYGMTVFRESSLFQKMTGQGYTKITSDLFIYSKHKSFHNAYIQVLLQYGIIGLAFFVGIIISSIFNSFKIMRKNHFLGVMFLSMTISMIAYMLTNTTLIMHSNIDSYMLTAFYIILPMYVKNAVEIGEFEEFSTKNESIEPAWQFKKNAIFVDSKE